MKLVCFSLFVLLIPILISAQTAEEIIDKAENAIKGKSAHGIIEMTVETPDYVRNLTMESWWIGNEKALIVILSQRKEKGNKTLKIGNEMWNYLNNTETTIKIPPSMMLQSWNGSDFTNDDLVRESNIKRDYDLKIIAKEQIDSVDCWKIECIPHPDAPVVWGKLYYWVRIKDFLPAIVQYYDEKGNLIRTMKFSDVKNVGNRVIPTSWKMISENKKGHSTELKIVKMEFDIPINAKKFSFRELERGR